MSNYISLSSIQSNQINSLCKVCSNAFVLIDSITFEWFRLTDILGHLICLSDPPTIKRIDDQDLFEHNLHSKLVIILSESISIGRLKEICQETSFESILLLTAASSIIKNEKQTNDERFLDRLEVKYLQYPFVSVTDHLIFIPTLIPHRFPSIEILSSLSSEKIKTITTLNEIFDTEEIDTIRIHADLINTLMTSLNAREDVFVLGPMSHLIAREYSQMNIVKQRRRSGEQKIGLLLVDRHLDLATVTSYQQDTLLAQALNILPNVRIQSSNSSQRRTIDLQVNTNSLLKHSSVVLQESFKSFLISDVKRVKPNPDAKFVFENILYSKAKIASTEIFTRLLESLIYNNLETKIKPMKVSAAAISACLEKFKQSPVAVCKNYELLMMSCCLMQLLDSVSQNQKFERLIGLEKILVQALGTNAGPSPFSIVLQTLKEDLNKPEEQRILKLLDYVIVLIHIYSLVGDDVFYGKEEKDRTHKIIGKEILSDSSFTKSLREEMTTLGFGLDIEQVLNTIYRKLDLLHSYKRRSKSLNSLIVYGNDEQPNSRQSLLKQILELYKRCLTNRQEFQQQLINEIEHVPFEGLTDFFKSAARGIFGDSKINLANPEYSTIVIFLLSGITAHEIQLVHDYSQQIKRQIIIVSSALIRPVDVFSLFQ